MATLLLAQTCSSVTCAVPRVILLYAIRLYALMAKKYATTVIPTHHARAIHISFPTGSAFSRERTVSTTDVTGWFSANALTTAGIVAVGTNAELMNGRKISGYENALAPSTDFAVSPGITASHSNTPAPGRKPMMRAIRIITTTVMVFETSDVSTCAHNIDERATGIE